MEIKYLQNLFIESKKIYANFKKENVFSSPTLKEMFSSKYIYKGEKPNTYLVKSLQTNKPVQIHANYTHSEGISCIPNIFSDTHEYKFYDESKNPVGYHFFYIYNNINKKNNSKYMPTGYMKADNEMYKGIGIREDEIQIKMAIDNNIKYIPRSSVGPATLFHVKMGFLPVTDDLIEVKSEFDVNRYMKGLGRGSKDIKPKNFIPIITKKDGRYFIDISKTQAAANVAEIKERLAEGYSHRDLDFLEMDGLPLALSGKEFEYWKNLISNAYLPENL